MKRYSVLCFCLLLAIARGGAQLKRSEAFHSKYELAEVVVLSRHNIRSPLSGNGSALSRITPHEWFPWSSAPSELSLRGGVLETMMGQYFRKWLVGEGLIAEHEQASRDLRFYANSMQRTIATAQYFSSGMLPVANVPVEHHCAIGTMDPVFNPQFTFVSEAFRRQAGREIAQMGGEQGMAGLGARMRDNYKVLEQMLDLRKSVACREGDTCAFRLDDTEVHIEMGKEPYMRGALRLANQASDALILQYYEETDARKAAFGHKLKQRDWELIAEVKDWYGDVLFTAPCVAVNVAHPLLVCMNDELSVPHRRFTFLCGHDSNIASVLAALEAEEYVLPQSIEKKTPIGSKLVIEKWRDAQGREYAALNLVYQSTDQLRRLQMMDLENAPAIFPIRLKGLTANADGLYSLTDLQQRFAKAITAYSYLPKD
ncbi:MAG: histidine-type phosphatase [Bacteroidaceae bacterium]|nr:histidine-type phosphatase [Bacteroidaceae bacterium]